MILYCATTNPGKLREFRQASGRYEILPLPGLAQIPAPEETGATFAENAILKALYYGRHTPGLLFAEDSGLEADGLQGAPGIYSARFAGPEATDEANNRLLIARLQGIENRKARYRCAIALVENGNLIETFEGAVEGEIVAEPQGAAGFGYDPHFYYPPYHRTFAQSTPEEKFAVSHRAQALRKLIAHLDTRQPEPSPGRLTPPSQ